MEGLAEWVWVYAQEKSIFTGSKQPWVTLTGDVPVAEEYYDEKGV